MSTLTSHPPSRLTATPPQWITPYPEPEYAHFRVRVSRVAGLRCPSGDRFEDSEGRPWVDASIVSLIVALNDAGFATLFCCSGLAANHEGRVTTSCPNQGYVSIEGGLPTFPFDVPPPLHLDNWGIRQDYGATDAGLAAAWVELERLVRLHYLSPS